MLLLLLNAGIATVHKAPVLGQLLVIDSDSQKWVSNFWGAIFFFSSKVTAAPTPAIVILCTCEFSQGACPSLVILAWVKLRSSTLILKIWEANIFFFSSTANATATVTFHQSPVRHLSYLPLSSIHSHINAVPVTARLKIIEMRASEMHVAPRIS